LREEPKQNAKAQNFEMDERSEKTKELHRKSLSIYGSVMGE
jgi:hypothetical protein